MRFCKTASVSICPEPESSLVEKLFVSVLGHVHSLPHLILFSTLLLYGLTYRLLGFLVITNSSSVQLIVDEEPRSLILPFSITMILIACMIELISDVGRNNRYFVLLWRRSCFNKLKMVFVSCFVHLTAAKESSRNRNILASTANAVEQLRFACFLSAR